MIIAIYSRGVQAQRFQNLNIMSTAVDGSFDITIVLYEYLSHNDVSVNDRLHIRQWSHKIIVL